MSLRETRNDTHTQYILQALFPVCRLVPSRQEEAARAGIIPYLKEIIQINSTSKQFALPIILELSRAKVTYPYLWENNCVDFYVSLFSQNYPWQIQALDALVAWTAAEPEPMTKLLSQSQYSTEFISLFQNHPEVLSALTESFLKLAANISIVRALIRFGFIPILLKQFSHPQIRVRVNLLKLLAIILESAQSPKELIQKYDLLKLVSKLETDKAVLVTTQAAALKSEILKYLQ